MLKQIEPGVTFSFKENCSNIKGKILKTDLNLSIELGQQIFFKNLEIYIL